MTLTQRRFPMWNRMADDAIRDGAMGAGMTKKFLSVGYYDDGKDDDGGVSEVEDFYLPALRELCFDRRSASTVNSHGRIRKSNPEVGVLPWWEVESEEEDSDADGS